MKFRRNIVEFKHLKLFGACSVATLLFCCDVSAVGFENFFGLQGRRAFIDVNLRQVVISETKKEDPKNNNTFNSSKNERRNTVKKVGKSSVVSEQEFAQWIGKFEENLVDPEELHFFSNSANYICQLVEQGANIRRNGVNYGNQCPILALNLDEGTMLRVYDEMDKFNDYGHNFANYMRGNGGLSDGDQKTWSRISDIIRHRVAIYTRHSDFLVCTIHGENKELPVKRVYLEPSHYQELLINKKQNAETSEQRNREEQGRETEAPKQEKQKTVEDITKEFINAIKAEKKPGEKKIDILKNIFENSGLTENEELKKEINLFESVFGESLNKFKSIWKNDVSSLKEEVSQTLKREFYNDDHFMNLKDGTELQGKDGLVSDLSKKVAELEGTFSKIKEDIFDPWLDKVRESSINEDVKKVLLGKLDERKDWFGRSQGQVSEYREMLKLISQRISESGINYSNPTFEQAKEFTQVEREKAIRAGVIKVATLNTSDWNGYTSCMEKVKSKKGDLKKAEAQKNSSLAWKFLIIKNRSLFSDPAFVRTVKSELIGLFDAQIQDSRIADNYRDQFKVMKEIVSKL